MCCTLMCFAWGCSGETLKVKSYLVTATATGQVLQWKYEFVSDSIIISLPRKLSTLLTNIFNLIDSVVSLTLHDSIDRTLNK